MRPWSANTPVPVLACDFSSLNIPPESIPTDTSLFYLSAEPQTDLWRQPPGQDTSTAPVLFRNLRFPFVCAEVTVSANWGLEWDQGGLVLFAGSPPGNNTGSLETTSTTSNDPPPYPQVSESKWVKIGLEYTNNLCQVTITRSTSHGADWSIAALPSYHASLSHLRVKLERLGVNLWLYYKDERSGWKKIREISGFFCGVADKSVRVGVYACRPAAFEATPLNSEWIERMEPNLTVEFENLVIF